MPIDAPRRIARRLMGGSAPWRAASWLAGQTAVLRRGGPAHVVALARAGDDVSVLPTGPLLHPFAFRACDVPVLVDNVYRREWGAFAPANPRVVVDAGANIGDTAAYFLSRHRDATVVALEPQAESFALAARNLAPYGERCILLRNALTAADGTTAIAGAGTSAKIADAGAPVEGVTVATLLGRLGIDRVDLFKMDIEGAEADIFAADVGWLDRVGMLILEIHDRAQVGVIGAAMARAGFAMRRYRNCYYYHRRPPRR